MKNNKLKLVARFLKEKSAYRRYRKLLLRYHSVPVLSNNKYSSAIKWLRTCDEDYYIRQAFVWSYDEILGVNKWLDIDKKYVRLLEIIQWKQIEKKSSSLDI